MLDYILLWYDLSILRQEWQRLSVFIGWSSLRYRVEWLDIVFAGGQAFPYNQG